MKIRISLLLIFLTTAITNAQVTSTALDDFLKDGKKNESKSFGKLDEYLVKNKLEFDNSEEVVKLFNEERIRLGANFESELWNYLENDLNKHYWINLFLEIEDYLGGNIALPALALRIREKSQDIQVEKDDISGLGMKFTILRKLTVDYYLNGKLDLAKTTKKKAEIIYRDIKDFGVVGADEEFIICIYENLEKDTKQCRDSDKNKNQFSVKESFQNLKPFSVGVLNGKAISLPAPEYPKAASAVGAEGTVNVQVTVDEKGIVILAEALSGHQLLRASAVEAAKKARFSQFWQQGMPVKIIGTIVYNFKR